MKICLLATSILALALSPVTGAEIRITVSDLIHDGIKSSMDSFDAESEMELKVEALGSLPALDRLRSDEIDLAIIAAPDDASVPREEFMIQSFAYDAAVVAVNEGNPIQEATLSALAGVYGSDEELNYLTWGDFGLTGWGNRNIKPVSAVAPDSIALELFRHRVLAGPLKTNVTYIDSVDAEDFMSSDRASIGILSRLPEGGEMKVLRISNQEDAPSFGPTEDNVHYGDYPIRLPFYLVYHERDQKKLDPFLRYLLEDSVAEDLRESGFFPLPDTIRRQKAIDFDMASPN